MLSGLTRTLRTFAPSTLATLILVWVFFIHASSIYLFTRGFLLTRLALNNKSTTCDSPDSCANVLLPTHSKAIFLIIDALRFDFISPNPPQPPNQFHHNILTLPAELTATHPDRSFIFNAHSDPPTATLQRIKGIMTGSLPTFVDIGSNFASSEIKEDSLVHQLHAAGKRIAFMGDDTWTGVYPSLSKNMTWPYDSFNVEDLHSVDEGVIEHLFPLLQDDSSQASWDFAIGHFLGVDHVGHRVGPSGETMRTKLAQMDTVLRKVVEMMQDDTLLVVIGDHGMDPKGDHGGDGILETSSAMWIYSKGVPLATTSYPAESPLPHTTFPGSVAPHRSVQQIDLVPSLSLLLGLPIPFNNLGMVIPELFLHYADDGPDHSAGAGWLSKLKKPAKQVVLNLPTPALSAALRLNAEQVQAYLSAYRTSASGSELDTTWEALNALYQSSQSTVTADHAHAQVFLRQTLQACRAMWAQFNVILMVSGLLALALSVPMVWSLYRALDQPSNAWTEMAVEVLSVGTSGVMVSTLIGASINVILQSQVAVFTTVQAAMLAGVIGGEVSVLYSQGSLSLLAVPQTSTIHRTLLPILILLLHAISYTSNSFLMWEDRLTQFFLLTLLAGTLVTSPSAPTRELRLRIFGYTIITGLLLRFIASSTVCREEQHPYCHVTFYASSTTPVAPLLTTLGAPLLAFALPRLIQLFLSKSKSDRGVAPLFLNSLWQPLLLAASVYWLLDRLESWSGLNPSRVPLVQTIRMVLARGTLGGSAVGLGMLWYYSAPCVEMQRKVTEAPDGSSRTQIIVLGFANAYGSSYLLFLLAAFTVVFALSQPTGQVVLAMTLVATLLHLEVTDNQNDSAGLIEAFTTTDIATQDLSIAPQRPTFAVPAFISITSLLVFYSTGHQAVMSTIQWKTAFIGFPVVNYFFSPLLVILNTFGPIALLTLAVPLYALWNVDPPTPQSGSIHSAQSSPTETRVLSNALKVSLGVSLYHSTLTFGTAVSAAMLRRHLMVWKVFAPRYMLGAVALLVVDAALVMGMGVGVVNVMGKVRRMFVSRPKSS